MKTFPKSPGPPRPILRARRDPVRRTTLPRRQGLPVGPAGRGTTNTTSKVEGCFPLECGDLFRRFLWLLLFLLSAAPNQKQGNERKRRNRSPHSKGKTG